MVEHNTRFTSDGSAMRTSPPARPELIRQIWQSFIAGLRREVEFNGSSLDLFTGLRPEFDRFRESSTFGYRRYEDPSYDDIRAYIAYLASLLLDRETLLGHVLRSPRFVVIDDPAARFDEEWPVRLICLIAKESFLEEPLIVRLPRDRMRDQMSGDVGIPPHPVPDVRELDPIDELNWEITAPSATTFIWTEHLVESIEGYLWLMNLPSLYPRAPDSPAS